MKVSSAVFTRAAVSASGWPKDSLAQIAFAGRSNVGKSSLINSLLNRKGLVRTSQTPGKTREINFFLINDAFYFVDLPGFGYAKVSQTMRADWGRMIEEYILNSLELRLLVHLVDIRHEPQETDLLMARWLKDNGIPFIVVATKADKISKGNRAKHLKLLASPLEIDPANLIEYSAVTGEGKERLWDVIRQGVKGR